VPANPPTSAFESLPRGILLVEEYSALRVAISSALRKFAPLHGVQVAQSFAEAETAAAAMRPELFVLDLDPPPSGEIEFFNKLKAHYPEARVLVIAAGTSRELRAERGTAGAIQFIEKPFDLAEFGAAVQALLGPWAAPPTLGLRGTLRDLHVVDIVQLKCLAGSTAVVRIEAAGDKSGEIHFQKGQICHAVTGIMAGTAALEEIVNWPDARPDEIEPPVESPRTIDAPWQMVLLQVVRKLKQNNRREPSGTAALPQSAAAKTGKKILVIDDTEMLLVFVADVLATADQNFQVLTTSSGAEGLRLATSERPDLVLLDYSLTDMTGDKVCRALLENPATARIPVLMMSGHLGELAKTAEDYENVVAALPKPFLSGALICAVEKVLAAGALPHAPGPMPKPEVAPVAPVPSPVTSPASTADGPIIPLSNGHGVIKSPACPAPSPPSVPPTTEPAKSANADASPPTPSIPAGTMRVTRSGAIHRPTELSVTLSFNVVAVQFTMFFEVETATLRPFDRIAAVKMGDREELKGVPLASGFRLDTISMGGNGTIDTMRLVPMHQPPQLSVPTSSFAVGASDFQSANAHFTLRLAAPVEAAMRVQLTATFELLAVEMSVGVEVAAILLKARERTVLVRNNGEGPGKPFEVLEAQLAPSTELQSLLVRALP
jgi:DNA-binding response OmpR family regulator